jgi:nucleoid-associated protein YgaU
MDRRMRIMLAGGVLLGGFLTALLFRHTGPQMRPPTPAPEQFIVRNPASQYAADGGPAAAGGSRSAAENVCRPAPTVLTPLEGTPPTLARSYPDAPQQLTTRWGVSMGLPESGGGRTLRAHRIVDGDTLPALARRYLGSADRATELYQANRDVLSSPRLLPIGAELKIPEAALAPAPGSTPADGALVPIER